MNKYFLTFKDIKVGEYFVCDEKIYLKNEQDIVCKDFDFKTVYKYYTSLIDEFIISFKDVEIGRSFRLNGKMCVKISSNKYICNSGIEIAFVTDLVYVSSDCYTEFRFGDTVQCVKDCIINGEWYKNHFIVKINEKNQHISRTGCFEIYKTNAEKETVFEKFDYVFNTFQKAGGSIGILEATIGEEYVTIHRGERNITLVICNGQRIFTIASNDNTAVFIERLGSFHDCCGGMKNAVECMLDSLCEIVEIFKKNGLV